MLNSIDELDLPSDMRPAWVRASDAGNGATVQKEEPTYPAVTLELYTSRSDVPFELANELLLEHAHLQAGKLTELGLYDVDAPLHIQHFWEVFEDYLPPDGSFYLAWDSAGHLLGTGSLRRVSPDTGEMKHLNVRPQARGLGLGRALLEARLADARLADARAMGLKTLLADTVASNTEMPSLYKKLGFEEMEGAEVCGSTDVMPELQGYMRYFRLTL